LSAGDAFQASFRAFDPDAEFAAVALERVDLAVEIADAHDAVDERGVAVVAETKSPSGAQ
jgi:hypothetical protein